MSFLLAGYLLFRWFEFQVKRRDTLEAMEYLSHLILG